MTDRHDPRLGAPQLSTRRTTSLDSRIVIVTGTDTGVGKTIATAALAATAPDTALMVKPLQTGVAEPGEPGDAATVQRLTGRTVEEFVALEDPLAPDTAARRQGVAIPTVAEHAARIRDLATRHDPVVVEGAGGLLVRLDDEGGTLLDLAADLARDIAVDVVVVCRAGLGTLNHTELTVTALRACGLEPAGLVIGAWPTEPDLAAHCNRDDLPHHTGVPVVATIPQNAGSLDPEQFRTEAPTWFARPRQ